MSVNVYNMNAINDSAKVFFEVLAEAFRKNDELSIMDVLLHADENALLKAFTLKDSKNRSLVDLAASNMGDTFIFRPLLSGLIKLTDTNKKIISDFLSGLLKKMYERILMASDDSKIADALKEWVNTKGPNDYRTLLDLAIQESMFEVCEGLLKIGASPNLASKGRTPLSVVFDMIIKEAKTLGRASYGAEATPLKKMLCSLINEGADLKEIYADNNAYLAWIATSIRLESLPGLKKERKELLEKAKQLVLISHRHDLTRANTDLFGHKITLEGLYEGITTAEIVDSFTHFVKNRDNILLMNELRDSAIHYLSSSSLDVKETKEFKETKEKKDVLESFSKRQFVDQLMVDLSNMAQTVDEKLFAQNQRLNELTVLPIATTIRRSGDHAQSYLFWGDYCLRVNCGGTVDQSKSPPGIIIYRIKDKTHLQTEIQKFIHSSVEPIEDAYLLNDFINRLGLEKLFHIQMPAQTVGNCAWRSVEALFKAVLVINYFRILLRQHEKNGYSTHQFEVVQACLSAAVMFADVLYRKFYVDDLNYAWENIKKINLEKSIPYGLRDRIEPNTKQANENYTKSLEALKSFLASPKPQVQKVFTPSFGASTESYSLPFTKKELAEIIQFYAKREEKVDKEKLFKSLLECGEEARIALQKFGVLFKFDTKALYKTSVTDLFVLELDSEKSAKQFAEFLYQNKIFARKKDPRVFDKSKVLQPTLTTTQRSPS